MSGDEIAFQQSMNEGHSAAWDGLWERAVVYYSQALDEFPDHPKTLTSLGLALFELGRYEESLDYYLKAVTVTPGDPLPLEKTAQLYEILERSEEATEASLKASEVYLSKRDVDKAIENLSRVSRINPENITAHSRLAMIYERLEHKQQSVVEYLALASLLQQGGKMEEAVQSVNRALQILPTSVEAHQALSLLRETKPLPKPTRPRRLAVIPQTPKLEQIEAPEFLEIDPVTEARQKAMGVLAGIVIESSTEDTPQESSIRGLQSIVRGASESLFARQEGQNNYIKYLNEAVNLQTQGEENRAVEALRNAMDAGLDDPAAFFDIGLLYIQEENFERAVESLTKAINHADFALGARILLGQSLHKLQRLNEAAIEYLEALKLADAYVVSPGDAVKLRQLYEPIIEAESQRTDPDAKEQLCKNIDNLLMRSDWRERLTQIRQELPATYDGGPPAPIAEILSEAGSSVIVESIATIHQLAREGLIRSAMEEAFYALHFAPTYLPLHIYMGDLLLQQELFMEAIAKFTIVAQTYSARGESSLAIEMLRRIVYLAPMDLMARHRLIDELTRIGQTEVAVEEYLKLADVHYNLADLSRARKTYTEALHFAQKTRVDDTLRVQILHEMADIDVQLLDWRQALRVYEQIKKVQPDDRRARARLVELNFRLGQEAKAMTEMDHFISHFLTGGQVAEAIGFLEGLVQENPNQKLIQRRLVDLYRREGRRTDAIRFLDTLGERLMLTGDRAGASEVIELILSLDPSNAGEYRKFLKQIRRN